MDNSDIYINTNLPNSEQNKKDIEQTIDDIINNLQFIKSKVSDKNYNTKELKIETFNKINSQVKSERSKIESMTNSNLFINKINNNSSINNSNINMNDMNKNIINKVAVSNTRNNDICSGPSTTINTNANLDDALIDLDLSNINYDNGNVNSNINNNNNNNNNNIYNNRNINTIYKNNNNNNTIINGSVNSNNNNTNYSTLDNNNNNNLINKIKSINISKKNK